MTQSPGSSIFPASPWPIAAPSFIWPARVGQNCKQLENVVDEAALVFFQTQGCLEYDQEDLPLWMADLNLSYHMHLPLDLPWGQGGQAAAETAIAVADKAAFCRPQNFVLHPPDNHHLFLDFHRQWCARGMPSHSLLLENIGGNDLRPLLPAIAETDCRICLDYGHLSVYGQWSLVQEKLVHSRLGMLHLYAPVGGHTHKGLTSLPDQDQDAVLQLLDMLPAGQTVVLEVFSWPELRASLDIFSSWIKQG